MNNLKKIPLLNDHHNHVSFYLTLRKCLDVRSIEDYNTALSLIKNLKEDINIVLGWTFGYDNIILEKIENELPPVLICGGGLHRFIMNQKAKKKLIKKFPEIVSNIENTDWIERNIFSIMKFIPQIKTIEDNDVHEYFDYLFEEQGIYKIEDLLLPSTDFIDTYERTGYSNRLKYWVDINLYKSMSDKYKSKISGIKLFLDGAIGPETAALNGYINSKSNGGMLLMTDKELIEDLKFAESEKTATAVHALGEIAIEQLIGVIERKNIKLPYLRIEHAQYISLSAAKKCKKLGIILSMQPNFSAETELFNDILTKKCLERNNPFRMLIDEAGFIPGQDLILGSDGMPLGPQTALQNVLFPTLKSQQLTLEEFVKGYCIDYKELGNISFEVKDNNIINVKHCI